VVGRALDGIRVPVRSVLDPACGDGAFLLGARRALGDGVRLVGCDVDADAVAAARARVPDASIVHGDALARDWDGARFDLIVGNPPFLGQMSADTTRGGRSPWGGGPYADAAAEFLALAVRLARPDGGRVALVLPQSLLGARDAGPIRDDVDERGALVHAWWSRSEEFDASVRTCALVIDLGGGPGPVARSFGRAFEWRPPVPAPRGRWPQVLVEDVDGVGDGDPAHADHAVDAGGRPRTLGDIAAFTVAFRDQYYAWAAAVADEGEGAPLVTSGLIEPGRCGWGERPVRFARRTFAAPRIDLDALPPRIERWSRARLVPKVLVANQTRRIEAVVDREGAWLPGVPVISATPHDGGDAALDRLCDALTSPAAFRWVRARATGTGLAATSVRLSPALLASIPLPG